jgi:uncharacterized damage-inducible protein DinB
MADEKREVWQRGPIEGVPGLLQPVAHALLQVKEETAEHVAGLEDSLLWEKPAGAASIAFHLKHIAGVIDRLFTYAKGEKLSTHQLEYLAGEAQATVDVTSQQLMQNLSHQIDQAIEQLKHTDVNSLLEHRALGRKQIPTNVIGLLFHAAEHAQRHLGQMIVTIKVLKL